MSLFKNTSPGSNIVPSGMVISVMNRARLHGMGVSVGVGMSGTGVDVGGSPGPGSGVLVAGSGSSLLGGGEVSVPAATVSATDRSMMAVCSTGEIELTGILHAVRESISKKITVGNKNDFFK